MPRDAPDRNYRDPNHKPELLCALTPFEALCGFRPVDETQELLAELALPELDFLTTALAAPEPLRTAFTAVLEHPDPTALVAGLVPAVTRLGRHSDLARVVELTSGDYPGDIGVVLALLLNHVRLEPGEAIYLGAGNVHAYLRGTGVEIMANSDNVLRCGLTTKHIDVPELLRVTDFRELREPRWPATNGVFAVPVPDFRLLPFSVSTDEGPVTLGHDEPWIVLCTEGTVAVGREVLTPGQAAFVPASDEAVPVEGKGTVFAAAAGVMEPVADA